MYLPQVVLPGYSPVETGRTHHVIVIVVARVLLCKTPYSPVLHISSYPISNFFLRFPLLKSPIFSLISSLMTTQASARSGSINSKANSGDVPYKCNHNIPAVIRIARGGKNFGIRFYGSSMQPVSEIYSFMHFRAKLICYYL